MRIWCLPFILILMLTSCGTPENELYIFTWADYIEPSLIERFEQEHNCRVIVDTFDSNESMYAKLKLGATGYDLIFPSGYFVQIMQHQGMLQPIDSSKIPNIRYLDPKYLDAKSYSIPFMMSLSGLGYRKDKVKDFEPTWGIFNRSSLKGRMTMLNDIRDTLGVVLLYLGYSANTTNPKEIDEAAETLIKWKKNLAKFENEQYKNGIASAEYLVVQGYNGDIFQVMQENDQVGFAFPKEGTTIALDLMVIPKHAANVELAEKFINFLCDPEIAALNMEHTLFLAPNLGAYEKLPPNLRENPALFPPKEILEKSEMIIDLGAAGELYNRAWDKVKAAPD